MVSPDNTQRKSNAAIDSHHVSQCCHALNRLISDLKGLLRELEWEALRDNTVIVEFQHRVHRLSEGYARTVEVPYRAIHKVKVEIARDCLDAAARLIGQFWIALRRIFRCLTDKQSRAELTNPYSKRAKRFLSLIPDLHASVDRCAVRIDRSLKLARLRTEQTIQSVVEIHVTMKNLLDNWKGDAHH